MPLLSLIPGLGGGGGGGGDSSEPTAGEQAILKELKKIEKQLQEQETFGGVDEFSEIA